MIKRCTCKHKSQDKIHGKGRRVFNQVTENTLVSWRCTVCGSQTSKGGKG